MAHIYISYAPEDYEFAEIIQRRLQREGFPVWIDADPDELPDVILSYRDYWRQEIDDAIQNAFSLITLVTPQANLFDHVKYEWTFALGVGVPVIPLIFETAELSSRLKNLTSLDFSNRRERPWNELITRLKELQTQYEAADRTPSRVRRSATQQADISSLRDALARIMQGETVALMHLVEMAPYPALQLFQSALNNADLRVPFLQALSAGSLGSENTHVFLSYSRRDLTAMNRLRDDMRNAGLQVWTDESLTPGTTSWQSAIEAAIERAVCVVVLFTPDSRQSEWVMAELQYARMQKVVIVPVLMRGDEARSIPMAFANWQWLDLREDIKYRDGLSKLVNAIQVYAQHKQAYR
jgi:hypothetical protein